VLIYLSRITTSGGNDAEVRVRDFRRDSSSVIIEKVKGRRAAVDRPQGGKLSHEQQVNDGRCHWTEAVQEE
jgi:hypothetical protein